MEKIKAGTKNRSPDGLSLPNQNTIIENIKLQYSIRWKKYNEIQLTKNKADLNNLKMKIHPPSLVTSIIIILSKPPGGAGGRTKKCCSSILLINEVSQKTNSFGVGVVWCRLTASLLQNEQLIQYGCNRNADVSDPCYSNIKGGH